jgi:hypothetical protein
VLEDEVCLLLEVEDECLTHEVLLHIAHRNWIMLNISGSCRSRSTLFETFL